MTETVAERLPFAIKRLEHWIANHSASQMVFIEDLVCVLTVAKEKAAWDSLASSMRPYTELMFVTLLAMESGELSEGRAVEMLKVNRMDLRDIRHGLVASLVEFSGKCKSPLTSLLAVLKAEQDSSVKTSDTPS